jgi:hypothetical protein
MPTLGLCMIVKDEAGVIERCLDSLRPLIDYVLVEDTGSTDGTQQVIAGWLAREGIPGVVIEEPWRDFAYNRTHALAQLRQVKAVDYAIMIDADDVLVLEPGFDPAAFKAGLKHDVLEVQVRQGELRWLRPQIGSNRIAFTLKGVLHECLKDDMTVLSVTEAKGLYIQTGREGARHKNERKYHDDAALLEKTLQTETEPHLVARYRFYLAQSYRDAGEKEKARENYLARAEMGGWSEEVFCSHYEAARLDEALGAPLEQVLAGFVRATEAEPTRAEAHYELARRLFQQGRFEEAYLWAKAALGRPRPADGLFVKADVYEHRLLDALAVAAFETGRWAQCEAACDRLIAEGRAPPDQRDRIAANKILAARKLRETADAAPGGFDLFLVLLQVARAKEEVLETRPQVLAAYAAASAAAPHRAEAQHGAALFCRNNGLFEEGCAFALQGLAIARPADVPALEAWIYDYGLLDELMANAFWAGRYAESAQACDRLLREGRIPADVRERLGLNRAVLDAKLQDIALAS